MWLSLSRITHNTVSFILNHSAFNSTASCNFPQETIHLPQTYKRGEQAKQAESAGASSLLGSMGEHKNCSSSIVPTCNLCGCAVKRDPKDKQNMGLWALLGLNHVLSRTHSEHPVVEDELDDQSIWRAVRAHRWLMGFNTHEALHFRVSVNFKE